MGVGWLRGDSRVGTATNIGADSRVIFQPHPSLKSFLPSLFINLLSKMVSKKKKKKAGLGVRAGPGWDFRVEYLVGAAKGVGAGWGLECVWPGITMTRGNFRRGRTLDMYCCQEQPN